MKKMVYIIAALWCLVTIGMILFNEIIFSFGEEVILKIMPYDPRDFLRGDYVTLQYEIEHLKGEKKDIDFDKVHYVLLEKDNDNIYHAKQILTKRPADGICIKGRAANYNYKAHEYNLYYDSIKRYYIKEGTGKKLEKDLANGGYAKVIIDRRGNSRIKEILTDKPLN